MKALTTLRSEKIIFELYKRVEFKFYFGKEATMIFDEFFNIIMRISC